MAKPAGARCNLHCSYCYYLGTTTPSRAAAGAPSGTAAGMSPAEMPSPLLESYIAQRIESASGPNVHFEWHGGEPTLLGPDYFRRITRLQRAHAAEGKTVTNGLQTNGTLIDAPFADFLAREGFSVGLSVDGPADVHDALRPGPGGQPSHERAMRAFRLLRERGVQCNLLCVLHSLNAPWPERVYRFFRDLGGKYLQFLPLAPRPAQDGARAAAASPEAVGDFLCAVFDLWIKEDVGRVVVQAFDEALRPHYGAPHALCVHRETCGDVAVLESDGSFYACDHFVDPAHLIGNLRETSLAALSSDPRLIAFGEAKRTALPPSCLACEFLSACNGGCPKDRFVQGPDGLRSYFCPAYKRFFAHSATALALLAAHMKAGKTLRSFSPRGD
jgi:uncharacterized protein